jgi:hypothetical protein
MKREIKLNNNSYNIDEVISISEEGGSQFFLIESLQSSQDFRFTFTKNFIKAGNQMIQPKEIDSIEFTKENALVILNNGNSFNLPIENHSIKSDSFIFEMKKTKKEKNGIAVWKVLSNIDENLRQLMFIREN